VTSTVPVILSQEPVSRGLTARMKISKPNIAVVYSGAFGEVASFEGRPLSWSQQVLSKYRIRYEVDLSDHRRTAQLDSSPLPSRGDVYFFRSTVDVGFRVSKPEEVVRRNVTDALPVVYNYLIDSFRPVTRQHEIDDAAGAEAQLNLLFSTLHVLEEGITIYHCATRLLPDTKAQQHLQSLNAATRTLNLNAEEHKVASAATRHGIELASLHHDARLEAERKEYAATAGRPVSLHSLIQAHLAKHPDQTDYALELLQRHELAMAAQRDTNDQRTLDLARYMMDQGLIQAVDIEMLRNDTLGRVQQITSPSPPPALTAGWDDPLPGDPAPVKSLPSPPAGHGDGAHTDPTTAIPVYLVVDESPADDAYMAAVNRNFSSLPEDLAQYPDIISAIRLAVLGYAADVGLRMPLTAVAEGSHVPSLVARGGANFAAALDDLRNRIADDVSRLKQRGLTVGRPTIYLLSATDGRDDSAWDTAMRRLTDRTTFPYAPNIFAFGVGEATAEIIIAIAGQSGSLGWVAPPSLSLAGAADSFTAFARKSILSLGRAHVNGRRDTEMPQPERFRAVGDRT
jgi:uncharacterized protein YegL